MKIVIENRDVDDPSDTKEIAPVELDLEDGAQTEGAASNFSALIEAAAVEAEKAMLDEERKQKKREAQAAFEAGQKALADKIRADTGFAVGYEKPWVYEPKPKAAYSFWKKVVPQFIERPDLLRMGPTKLVALFAPNEANFVVNRDMFYDELNVYAVAELKRLLRSHGKALPLKSPVTIRSVQKELKDLLDATRLGGETAIQLVCKIEIGIETAKVNGVPYKIQRGASGKPRIKRDGQWLSLDAVKVFCEGSDGENKM